MVHRTDEGKPALPPRHLIEKVLPAVEDDSLGHTLIVAPPGSIKTNTMVGACAWWLGHDPSLHIGYICSNVSHATARSLAVRDTIEQNPLYQSVFPAVKPNKSRGWAQDAWYLERPNLADKNASFLAAGVQEARTILGCRFDRVVLDDIADADNMKSETQRKDLARWLGATFMPRLHPARGRAILIMTRWHEEDPAQWALDRGWSYVHIPALDERGESYWPEYFPASFLACPGDNHPEDNPKCCMKRMIGPTDFAQQYQGEVSNEASQVVRREWWRTYDPGEWGRDAPDLSRGAIFVDLAHEEKTTADYTVLAPWAACPGGFYAMKEFVRERMSFPEVERRLIGLRAIYRWPIIIEETSGSKPLIQSLRAQGLWGVIGMRPEGSKLSRLQAVAHEIEYGRCYLPRAHWTEAFISEHAAFPLGRHDDMVDTTAMMLLWNTQGGRPRNRSHIGRPFHREWEKVSA